MIKQILFLCVIAMNYLYAVDATMEIVKRKSTLPNIVIAISKESSENKLAVKIKNLIEKDLEVSGHFQTKNSEFTEYFNSMPQLKILKKDEVDLFINLHTESTRFGNTIVNIKLYDINSNEMILTKSYSINTEKRYPFLSHKIAIDINKYFKAPSIDWMDKFVIFARYKNAKQSEIVVSDYTLTYQKVVVSGGLNIFPKWASKKQESFYYTSYSGLIPKLKKQNIYTSKVTGIASSDGMIICSDISSKDSNIILTMAPNAQPDIYTFNLDTKVKTRITNYKGIDVGGSFVENNKKIVFISDRLRYPNIFAKTIGQKGVERLVYHGKNNSQCTTFDNYIVYASRESDNEFSRNAFNLYLISTRSDFIRRLTTTGRNQFPKFSEDGDSILFIKRYKSKSYLGIIRLKYNKSFLFPLKNGKLQSIDW